MMTGGSGARIQIMKFQALATKTQASPISGTKYTVLDTTKNVRIISAEAHVTWTVQPTPLEIHMTVDGQSLTFSKANPVSTTPYMAIWNPQGTLLQGNMGGWGDYSSHALGKGFLLEARSVKIEIETTGGTVSELKGQCYYQKIP